MVDKISLKILNLLSDASKTEEEKEVLLFGITRIVEDIPKTIGIIIIGLMLEIIKEMLIVTVIIATYKSFTGGVHAKTNIGCFIYSAIFYIVIIYSAKYIRFDGIYQMYIYFLIFVFAIYSILVYVPADVPEIPKVDVNLRKKLKIKSIITLSLIYFISFVFIKKIEIQVLLIYSVLFISIMTTRSIYKLFGAEYGFETYIPY